MPGMFPYLMLACLYWELMQESHYKGNEHQGRIMLLISRLRCWEGSQFLTLLLQWLGRKELEQLFPTGLHLFYYYYYCSHNWSLLAGILHTYFTYSILFIWLVLSILILYIAYYLYGCILYGCIFIWLYNLKFWL